MTLDSKQPTTLDSKLGWLNEEVQWHRAFDRRFDLEKAEGDPNTLLLLVTALAGEVGEVANIVRKWADGVKDLDMDHLAEECADVLVFLTVMASYAPFDFSAAYEAKKKVLVERWTERRGMNGQ